MITISIIKFQVDLMKISFICDKTLQKSLSHDIMSLFLSFYAKINHQFQGSNSFLIFVEKSSRKYFYTTKIHSFFLNRTLTRSRYKIPNDIN